MKPDDLREAADELEEWALADCAEAGPYHEISERENLRRLASSLRALADIITKESAR